MQRLDTIGRTGDDAVVHLDRDFAASLDEVWRMLTDPVELAL